MKLRAALSLSWKSFNFYCLVAVISAISVDLGPMGDERVPRRGFRGRARLAFLGVYGKGKMA